jgi:hypothetical protein
MLSFRSGILLFFGSLAFVGILALTVGIYFDGGSDVYGYQVMSGHFTSAPVPYFSSFGLYAFSSGIIAWLYKLSPHIPWFDLLVFLNIGLTVFLFLWLWYIHRHSISPILLILFALPWLDNVLLPEFTKQGFWIAFLSAQIYLKYAKGQKILKAIMIVLFAYSFTIRAEAAFLALICCYLYQCTSAIGTRDSTLISINRCFLPFISIAIIFSVLLNINFTKQDKLYRAFRPYQFTLWDFKQDPTTIKLNSAEDSIILMAAQNHFISDTSKINETFFKKIGLHSKDKTMSSMPSYFENERFLEKKIKHELKSARDYLSATLAFAGLFLLSFLLSPATNGRQKIASSLVFISCLSILLFLLVFMKWERHVVLPLMSGALLYIIYARPAHSIFRLYQIAPVALGIGLMTYNVWGFYKTQKSESKIYCSLGSEIKKQFPEALIYIDLYTMVKLHDKLFATENFTYEKSLSFDNAIISYYPEWAEKMAQLKQPCTMAMLGDKFQHDSPKTIFIFNRGREHLFEKYFLVVYGKRVTFEEVDTPSRSDQKYPYAYFHTIEVDQI